MNQKRKRIPNQGDVVLLEFPGVRITKRRPAVVLSSANYHAERPDVIVGIITNQIAKATTSLDYVLEDWKQVGLSRPSAYRTFLTTIPGSGISGYIGKLSRRDWQGIHECIQLALRLP